MGGLCALHFSQACTGQSDAFLVLCMLTDMSLPFRTSFGFLMDSVRKLFALSALTRVMSLPHKEKRGSKLFVSRHNISLARNAPKNKIVHADHIMRLSQMFSLLFVRFDLMRVRVSGVIGRLESPGDCVAHVSLFFFPCNSILI